MGRGSGAGSSVTGPAGDPGLDGGDAVVRPGDSVEGAGCAERYWKSGSALKGGRPAVDLRAVCL